MWKNFFNSLFLKSFKENKKGPGTKSHLRKMFLVKLPTIFPSLVRKFSEFQEIFMKDHFICMVRHLMTPLVFIFISVFVLSSTASNCFNCFTLVHPTCKTCVFTCIFRLHYAYHISSYSTLIL